MEKEGDLARSAEVPSLVRVGPNSGPVSIEGRGSLTSTGSPAVTLEERKLSVVDGVYIRSELLESFSL